jgi:hypothetical protein
MWCHPCWCEGRMEAGALLQIAEQARCQPFQGASDRPAHLLRDRHHPGSPEQRRVAGPLHIGAVWVVHLRVVDSQWSVWLGCCKHCLPANKGLS